MTDETDPMEFFLNEKPVMALIEINRTENCYGTILSKKIDTTYSHTTRVIGELVDRGLVERREDGRKNILSTTERGEILASKFSEVLNQLEVDEQSEGVINDRSR